MSFEEFDKKLQEIVNKLEKNKKKNKKDCETIMRPVATTISS
jgi:hypothetical protein